MQAASIQTSTGSKMQITVIKRGDFEKWKKKIAFAYAARSSKKGIFLYFGEHTFLCIVF